MMLLLSLILNAVLLLIIIVSAILIRNTYKSSYGDPDFVYRNMLKKGFDEKPLKERVLEIIESRYINPRESNLAISTNGCKTNLILAEIEKEVRDLK